MSVTTTTGQWQAIREALAVAAERFGGLLRTARDPSARAVGDWSIAETAAHVAVVSRFDTHSALEDEPPPEFRDLAEMARSASVGDVGRINEISLQRETERDLGVLAARVEEAVAGLLEATARSEGNERVTWLGGMHLPLTGVLAHYLSELLVHGFDIARAERRAFPIPASDSAMIFDAFFVNLLKGDGATRMLSETSESLGDVACEFRLRGAAPVVFAFEDASLTVEDPGRRVDVKVSADPTSMMLVMYNRISPFGQALRGKMIVWGRRPWRLRRLMKVMQVP